MELARRAVSVIFENYLSGFHRIFLLFDTGKSVVFQIFLLRSIKAYLCPNTINFDSVDLSERRPEEVMFLSVDSYSYFTHDHKSNLKAPKIVDKYSCIPLIV